MTVFEHVDEMLCAFVIRMLVSLVFRFSYFAVGVRRCYNSKIPLLSDMTK